MAVDLCIDKANKIVCVTGEAGTGKTVIIGKVFEFLTERKLDVAICAPTGRAASRIAEATRQPAKTIHRLLRWTRPREEGDQGLPRFDAFNKMPYDVILVDEASMASEELVRALFAAMKPGAVIRFFGDDNQLPPVEGISPFRKYIAKYPTQRLTKNFRSNSGIITAAHQILTGRVPTANPQFTILNIGQGLTLNVLAKYVDESFKTLDSQIIIPVKGGLLGTEAVNAFMQQKLNGNSPAIKLTFNKIDRRLRKGDKVVWTNNDYKLDLYNGQVGILQDFDTISGELVINFDGADHLIPTHLTAYDPDGNELFPYDPRKFVSLAYAMTTHKSQGSEFQRVVVLLQRSWVMERSNFYTAVTRARKHVTVLAASGGLAAAMRKESERPPSPKELDAQRRAANLARR